MNQFFDHTGKISELLTNVISIYFSEFDLRKKVFLENLDE